jgi:hypothetical protein
MKIRNVHERVFTAPIDEVGALLDSLSSRSDRLWPGQWPPMRFDRPLQVGAVGGHGPIRYKVEEYGARRLLRFRFTGPEGFHGSHRFEVTALPSGESRLRHVLEMEARGGARISWPLVFRPLHDALLEDSLDRAEASLGRDAAQASQWSWYVRLLRWILRARGGRKPR